MALKPGAFSGEIPHAGALLRPVVVTLAAFSPALWCDFVDWDDYPNLVENPRYRGLGSDHLIWSRGRRFSFCRSPAACGVGGLGDRTKGCLIRLFFLLTILLYLRAKANPSKTPGHSYFAASIAAYLFSLLAKAIGMTLPIVLLILDVYPLRRLPPRLRDWLKKENRGVLLEKLPFVLLAGVFAIVAYAGQEEQAGALSLEQYGWGKRGAQAAYSLATLMVREGKVEQAIELYRQVLGIRPKFVEARGKLGAALFLQGQPEEAIAQSTEDVRAPKGECAKVARKTA